jgi:molybdenum cofactor guanylyltransferase
LKLPKSCVEPDAAGFVLAGGRSTRMGADKALVELAGRPLVTHALRILRDAGLSASIAGARSSLAAYAPVVEDASADSGPLAGVCAALASSSARYAVFVPVDQPFLPASLVSLMLHEAQVRDSAVTVASVNGYAQTFPAVVDWEALPALEAQLKTGLRGCFSAFQFAAAQLRRSLAVLRVEMLVQARQVIHPQGLPAIEWFLNINSATVLRRAAAILRGRSME